jgi:hypothetical protein
MRRELSLVLDFDEASDIEMTESHTVEGSRISSKVELGAWLRGLGLSALQILLPGDRVDWYP